MTCINGHPLAPSQNFCAQCGSPRGASAPTAPASSSVCLSGHPLAPAQNFCNTCGSRAASVAASPFLSSSASPMAATPTSVAPSSSVASPRRNSNGSAFFFLGAGILALIADFAPGVSTSSLGGFNAYHLGIDRTSIASARWLMILAIYSIAMGISVLRSVKFAPWTFWLRAALSLLYIWQGVVYYDYCKNFALGFSLTGYGSASVAAAPILAILAAVAYGAGAIWLIVGHLSSK